MPVKIVSVPVPEYTVSREPDYFSIGRKVDRVIEANFPDGTYILRAIGLDDHPGMTLDGLTHVVLETGTDKYDPARAAIGQEEFSCYDYDIQAGPIEIRESRVLVNEMDSGIRSMFGGIVWHFYNGAPQDRGHPVRIDLLLLYDPRDVVGAGKTDPGARGVRPGLAQHLYRFRDRGKKPEALRGLVRVTR